jgi:hypothetical protein
MEINSHRAGKWNIKALEYFEEEAMGIFATASTAAAAAAGRVMIWHQAMHTYQEFVSNACEVTERVP